jgi:two-component system OmpR family response regulator
LKASKKRILLVDDEARIREVVEYALDREGFEVVTAADGRAGLARLGDGGIDLVVLDVMMPELDGLGLLRRLRAGEAGDAKVPVLFLSARSDEIDRVLGLELGGDDYLVKPFSPRELVARVRALLRRSDTSAGSSAAAAPDAAEARTVVHGSVHVDLERWEVRVRDERVDLTRTELMVLAALLERPGIVLSRAQLVQRGYPYDNLVTERTIDTHVRRVRAKFRPHGVDPIATVHGVGYKAADLGA